MNYTKIKTSFTNFIINRFAPDYEKIKSENKKLKQDIYNLVRKGDEVDGFNTKLRWHLTFLEDDMLILGDGY